MLAYYIVMGRHFFSKQKLKRILKIFLHLTLQIIFSRINLFGFISPVGLAFAFSKIYFDSNLILTALFYFASKIYTFADLKMLFITGYEIVFLTLYSFSNEYLKFNKKLLMAEIFLSLANVLMLYFSTSSIYDISKFLINFGLELVLFLYFYKFEKTYKNKLIFYKFSKNDYFVFSVFVLMLSLGVFSFAFIEKYLGLFLIVLFIVFGAKIFSIDRFFVSEIVVLVGLMLVSQNEKLFIFGIILGTIAVLIKEFNKWIYAFVLFAFSLFFLIIFKILTIFNIFLVFFAIFAFILFPSKFINKFAELFEKDAVSIIFYNHQEQKVLEVKNRLLYMSKILEKMQFGFKDLLIGKLDRNLASKELAGDVVKKACLNCENYKFCFMGNINKMAMIENMLFKAIEHKEIQTADLMCGLQAYCGRSNVLAGEINQMAQLFLKYERAMKSEDESKLIISSEIENFAGIFKNFAKNIKNDAKINQKLSKYLKECLINALIDAKECMIFENEQGICEISLIISNSEVLKKELVYHISKAVGGDVQLKKVSHLSQSGLSLASFVVKSKTQAQFFVSSKSKGKVSGDNAGVFKLADNKYFVAIADGMGHGEQANKISSLVLDLIKSMFEVGLESNLVLESVNKLLIPAGLDSFSSLDACVIDLNINECVFIKLGASVSVLKHENTSEIISCESLPIGMVSSIKPTIIRKPFFAGDKIFLASDGVVDSFSSISSFATFINDAKIYNMQKFLDNVIYDAESLNQSHIDDMTIIGINLLKN